jgi:hypothetical protein
VHGPPYAFVIETLTLIERGSIKDEIIVTVYIIITLSLLVYAVSKPIGEYVKSFRAIRHIDPDIQYHELSLNE